MRRRTISELRRDVRGTATVEFVVLLVCVAVGFTLAWRTFGERIVSIISGD